MCDICALKCVETGCTTCIPIHPGWTAFYLEPDELDTDEEDLRKAEYRTVYMRFVGAPAILRAAEQRQRDMLTRLGIPIFDRPSYGVGERDGQPSGICPNGLWYQREDCGASEPDIN